MKNRTRSISPNECVIYQLIESCLKLDLDTNTAIEAINIVLKKCKYLFDKTHKTIRITKMDYRNYQRYLAALKKMSNVHSHLYKEINGLDKENSSRQKQNESIFNYKKLKPVEINQIENLLFLLNEDNKDLIYKKYVIADTDNLIIKALIYLDKKYIF